MRLQVSHVTYFTTAHGSYGTQVNYLLNGVPTVARCGVEKSFVEACEWVLKLWRPYAK